MPNFKKICERLTKLEALRLEPVDPDKLNKALRVDDETPIESLEKSFDEFVNESAFIEEEVYSYSNNVMPSAGYGSFYVQSPETMDLIRSLPYQIRQSLSSLRKQKKPDEIIVYSKDKGELIIVKKDEMSDYIAGGYNLIYEEDSGIANVSGVDEPYGDTSGAFDRVSGKNTPLFKKNRKELKKFKGKIFDVSPAMFERMNKGRTRYESWSSYIQEEGDEAVVNDIRRYSLRNSKSPVVIQNTETGERAMLRRRHSDNRLRHNRNKVMQTYHEQSIGKNFRRKRAY